MHPLSFAIKRAHLRVVAVSSKLSLPFGLTPARFDLLFTVREICPFEPRQRDLSRILGLSAATVSRMLRSLESLGLVRRRRRTEDLRTNAVHLTAEGQHRVRLFLQRALRPGALRRRFESGYRLRRGQLSAVLASLYADLRVVAATFGDRSRPPYGATYLGDRPPRPAAARDSLPVTFWLWRPHLPPHLAATPG